MNKMNKLLGMSLAIIMVLGSVPLGFSEPLREQLEQGLEIDQIQCGNPNHTLVERSNGKLACVTEKTSEKLGWEIIETGVILPVDYEFPLTAKHLTPVTYANGEPALPSYSQVDLKISNLPKTGESATVTVTVNGSSVIEDIEDHLYIWLSKEFQVVSGFESLTKHVGNDGSTGYTKDITLEGGNAQIFNATIIASGDGEADIGARTIGEGSLAKASFELVIGTNETLLADDYYKKYPSTLTAKLTSIETAKQLAIQEEILEEDRLLAEGCQMTPIGMWCPPTLEEMIAISNNNTADSPPLNSEEDLRAYLKADGASDEEIEEIVREAYPKASTQSFSFLQPAFASHSDRIYALGRLTADSIQLSPTSVTSTTIHGAQVCASEWDTVSGTLTPLRCAYTSDSGRYVISPLTHPPGSQDNTLDIILTFTTNGRYAYVSDAASGTYQLSTSPYNTGFDYYFGQTGNIFHNEVLTMGTVDGRNAHADISRAFWIVDAISDTNQWLEDTFRLNIRQQIQVGWESNQGTRAFGHTVDDGTGTGTRIPADGAFYVPTNTIETMFLDGFDTTNNRADDSNERWTIIHEYGHFVVDKAYRNGAFAVTDCNGPHRMLEESGARCAWNEGWADILPSLVDDSARYPRTLGVDGTITRDNVDYNYEEVTWYSGQADTTPNALFDSQTGARYLLSSLTGELVEGQVAGTIWDLYDSNRESGYDDISATQQDDRQEGYDEIKFILDDREPVTFQQFYDEWQLPARGYADSSNVMNLHFMSFIVAQVAPEIDNVRNLRVVEGVSGTTNVRATDANQDRITLSLVADPDHNTPVPSWITLTDNGDGTGVVNVNAPSEVPLDSYRLRAIATANGDSDFDDFRVYITEVNQDPILTLIDDKTVQERSNLSFTVSATDADIPAQTLRYSITNTPPQEPSDVPDNINLNPITGEFSWTPTNMQTGFHAYVFTVTDSQGATDSQRVEITVTGIPNSSPGRTPTPTASSITTASVTIDWTAPSSGTSPITEYDIFRAASPKELVGTVPASQLSYTDGTVLPSTTYQYTVVAKSQVGSGVESDPLSVRTLDLPTPPSNSISLDFVNDEFIVNYDFPNSENCVTRTGAYGEPFTPILDSPVFFPVNSTIAGGTILYDYYYANYTDGSQFNEPVETINCSGAITMPLSNFYGDPLFRLYTTFYELDQPNIWDPFNKNEITQVFMEYTTSTWEALYGTDPNNRPYQGGCMREMNLSVDNSTVVQTIMVSNYPAVCEVISSVPLSEPISSVPISEPIIESTTVTLELQAVTYGATAPVTFDFEIIDDATNIIIETKQVVSENNPSYYYGTSGSFEIAVVPNNTYTISELISGDYKIWEYYGTELITCAVNGGSKEYGSTFTGNDGDSIVCQFIAVPSDY